MKKGDYIKISTDAKYSGQDMGWTEEVTGRETLPAGTILHHYSDDKLSAFYPKTTCFFDEDIPGGHCYLVMLKKDVQVVRYGYEVRFEISNDNCKIQYTGTVTYNNHKRIDRRI